MPDHTPLISVLGDSISTFEGFTPPAGTYYTRAFASVSGVASAEDTWWMQVIHGLNGSLLANHSWMGSSVSLPGLLPACSPSRIRKLSADGIQPDIILFFSGMNDVIGYISPEIFRRDYAAALQECNRQYPNAKILCATLPWGYISAERAARDRAGDPYIAYNAAIRAASGAERAAVMELAALRYESTDGAHPTAKGMAQIAKAWLRGIRYSADMS